MVVVGGRKRRTGSPAVEVVERVDTHCHGVVVDRPRDAVAVVAGRRRVVGAQRPSTTAVTANRDSRHNNPAAEQVADTDRLNQYYRTNCVLRQAPGIVPTSRPDCRNPNTVGVAFLHRR
jgi:hypothetical protein